METRKVNSTWTTQDLRLILTTLSQLRYARTGKEGNVKKGWKKVLHCLKHNGYKINGITYQLEHFIASELDDLKIPTSPKPIKAILRAHRIEQRGHPPVWLFME